MDTATKTKIAAIKELLKKKEYQQALSDLQVLIYKQPKLYQAHLMAGLCYDKIGKQNLAQKCYLQVLDLKDNEPNAIKALCELYSRQENGEKATQYMELHIQILKKSDPSKYKQQIVKLVKQYQKNEDMEKIDKIFKQYLANQEAITDDFVSIAASYFRTGVTNECFTVQEFLTIGVKGQTSRKILPSAKEPFNYLIIDIMAFLQTVKIKYHLSDRDITNSLFEMKQYFPEASCLLMLFLLDEYCISHVNYSTTILQQIYLFLQAVYDRADNCYLNLQILDPQIFSVCLILGYEYIAFFKQFFSLDQNFDKYYDKLAQQAQELSQTNIRQSYTKVIKANILKECRTLSRITQTQNVQKKLQALKLRIDKLDNSFLEEVIAKMAMHCFVDYQQLSSMKNMLKVRINNLGQQDVQPHLYKYYYDYIIKISKIFKVLDQEINVYSILQYIIKYDPNDHKYRLQYYWLQFSKQVKQNQDNTEKIQQILNNIHSFNPYLVGQLKSQAIRKSTIIQIYLKRTDVLDGLKIALGIDRSFQNLQCIGFYYYANDDIEKALKFLKEAFILNQTHYHLNRIICVCLIKLNMIKQAYSFLERIFEGFPTVFWVNYMLAMNSISNVKLQAAEQYLTTAIETFKSAIQKNYKFSYQKTEEASTYSLFYMIDQNEYSILHDEFVIPEEKVYEHCPIASSLLAIREVNLTMIKLNSKIGQVLKILGRTKSAYNYLYDAYYLVSYLTPQQKDNNMATIVITCKEFGTILFYMGYFKQAQSVLKETLTLIKQSTASIFIRLQSQIKSLLFEVSVERLSEMMKFQSHQTVTSYIQSIPSYHTQSPSLNFFKSKYQFHILSYIHNSSLTIDPSIQAITHFLSHLKLNPEHTHTLQFHNRIQQLPQTQVALVKECLQDYYVLLYIEGNKKSVRSIQQQNILPLIQIFPKSTVFYIIYGMTVQNIKLKIAAFLKCIQLDRQSPISVDLLASLYLKEKDYLTACKLFLKSLQIQLFNPKCYVGLCICLYSIICKCYTSPSQQEHSIIKQAINRINSYMQFLRYVDPSQNYQILKFMKIILSQGRTQLTEVKGTLQFGRKYKKRQSLVYRLLNKMSLHFEEENSWKEEHKRNIVNHYITNNSHPSITDQHQICKHLINKAKEGASSIKDYRDKHNSQLTTKYKSIIIQQLAIASSFAQTLPYSQQILAQLIKVCSMITIEEELKELMISLKENMYTYVMTQSQYDPSSIHSIQTQVFPQLQTYEYILTHAHKIPKLKQFIHKKMLISPTHPTLRKAIMVYLIQEKCVNLKKIKNSEYKLQIVNDMNSDNVENMVSKHKKMILLYNDPNAWINYISQNWHDCRLRSQHNIVNWIRVLNRVSSSPLEDNRIGKCRKMMVQMQAYLHVKYNNTVKDIQYSKQQQCIINVLQHILEYENGSTFSYKSIHQHFQLINIQNQQWIIMNILTHIINQYTPSSSLNILINNTVQKVSTTLKPYSQLLKFIVLSTTQVQTEDELINILKELMLIISQSQQNQTLHPNCIIVMKCIVAILSYNYEQLQKELQSALNHRFATYSDQLLINYFETIKVYKEVEQHSNAEGVYENFTLFIDQIIMFAKEPYYKGFFLSLKALAKGIISSQSHVELGKELKHSLLLSPQNGKHLIN